MANFVTNLLIRFYKSKLKLAHKYTASEQRMFDNLMELTSEEGRKAILSLISGISDHPGVIFAALLVVVVAMLLLLPRVSNSTPSH